ncbi:Hypothetical_protein [Hexamita inflata]|uniref:Hypothetical_protein n=1 Tax=Hexamita inflata TaxID=28002 RepID=A0AA86NDD9_9EUKA|nr:Hypothetical protein HINF_LOCUS5095 [Hexamita inflata]
MKKQLFPQRKNSRARKTVFFLAETKPGRKKRAQNLETRVRFGKPRFSQRKRGSKLTSEAGTGTFRCPPRGHISYERAREDSRRKFCLAQKACGRPRPAGKRVPAGSGRCSGNSREERYSQRLVWGRLPAEEGQQPVRGAPGSAEHRRRLRRTGRAGAGGGRTGASGRLPGCGDLNCRRGRTKKRATWAGGRWGRKPRTVWATKCPGRKTAGGGNLLRQVVQQGNSIESWFGWRLLVELRCENVVTWLNLPEGQAKIKDQAMHARYKLIHR